MPVQRNDVRDPVARMPSCCSSLSQVYSHAVDLVGRDQFAVVLRWSNVRESRPRHRVRDILAGAWGLGAAAIGLWLTEAALTHF